MGWAAAAGPFVEALRAQDPERYEELSDARYGACGNTVPAGGRLSVQGLEGLLRCPPAGRWRPPWCRAGRRRRPGACFTDAACSAAKGQCGSVVSIRAAHLCRRYLATGQPEQNEAGNKTKMPQAGISLPGNGRAPQGAASCRGQQMGAEAQSLGAEAQSSKKRQRAETEIRVPASEARSSKKQKRSGRKMEAAPRKRLQQPWTCLNQSRSSSTGAGEAKWAHAAILTACCSNSAA